MSLTKRRNHERRTEKLAYHRSEKRRQRCACQQRPESAGFRHLPVQQSDRLVELRQGAIQRDSCQRNHGVPAHHPQVVLHVIESSGGLDRRRSVRPASGRSSEAPGPWSERLALSYDALAVLILSVGVPNIIIAAFYIFQHRLMWRDYERRKRLNGNNRNSEYE